MLHQIIMFHYFIAAFVISMYEPEKKNNEQDWLQVVYNLKSPKNFTCPSGKFRTEFTTLIAKFTSHRLSDSTFFAYYTPQSLLTAHHKYKYSFFFFVI